MAKRDSVLYSIDTRLDSVEQQMQTLLRDGTDYAADIRVFAIPLFITVVALMLPLIFQIITQIDSKYVARDFAKLYQFSWPVVLFFVLICLCLIVICSYAIFRKCTIDLWWRISLFVLAISLLGAAIWSLIYALQLNNPQKLLSKVFAKYKSGACKKDQVIEFHQLCAHLAHYAITSDITLLHDFVNTYAEQHIRTMSHTQELYEAILGIASDYKKKEDDPEVNAALAYLLATFVPTEAGKEIVQDAYNMLIQALYICIRNEHYTLINDFQHRMRHAYAVIAQQEQPNTEERKKHLRLFMHMLNALLYGKGCMTCVDNAIRNNFDAIIIGEDTIIPLTSNYCLDEYLYLREVLTWGKEYSHYAFVASDMTSNTNITQLSKYFAGYFAYLIKRMHAYPLCSDDIVLSAYLREDSVRYGFDALLRNAPDDATKSQITTQRILFEGCRIKRIKTLAINKDLCEKVFAKRIAGKALPISFQGLATFNPVYLAKAEGCQPIVLKDTVDRAFLQNKSLKQEDGFIPIYDIGSKAIDCIMDCLAKVYSSFERIEEAVPKTQLNARIREYNLRYDYSYLSFGVHVSHQANPCGNGFAAAFHAPCVVVIPIPDLPYLERTDEQCELRVLEELQHSDASPQVSIKVDLHMNIRYNKDTKIHVLKVV